MVVNLKVKCFQMDQEDAASHPRVAQVFEFALKYVANWAGTFVDAIVSNVDHLPYGLRYMAKVKRTALREKFPRASEKEIFKASQIIDGDQF